MRRQDDEKLVIRYLLGDLPEAERVAVEERFFADDEFYAFMQAVQEDLIDDYVQGDLAGRDRRLFEEHFLSSPHRRERVEFASALAAALTATRAPAPKAAVSWWQSLLAFIRAQNAAFRLAAAAAMLLLMAGLAWLALENRRLGASLEQARRERDAAADRARDSQTKFEQRRQELENEMAELRARGSEAEAKLQEKQRELERLERAQKAPKPQSSFFDSVISFALTPGIVRAGPDDAPKKLDIPPSARSVRLQLDLEREEPYRNFRAELRRGGRLVWSQDGLPMRPTRYGWAVTLRLPARILSGGEHEITLKGATARGQFEDVAFYHFIPVQK